MNLQPHSVDERFLEVLLSEAYHPTQVEPILLRAMAQLQSNSETRPLTQRTSLERTRWYSAIFSILAAVLLLSLLAVWPSESSASESLRQVVAAVELPEEREYEIVIQGRVKVTARLWVQGGDRFVLRLPAILPNHDAYVWLGSNGSDFWFVPAIGPIVVHRDADWLQRTLEQQQNMPLPILHLSSITRRLQTRYAVPQLLHDTPGVVHLQTKQLSPATKVLPHLVDIFARSKVIEKLVLHWNETASSVQPFDMTFTLNPSSTQPSNWYDHAAHHTATRRVIPAQEAFAP